MSIKKSIALALCGLLCLSTFIGCVPEAPWEKTYGTSSSDPAPGSNTEQDGQTEEEGSSTTTQSEGSDVDSIQATITMEDGGVIVMELYPNIAPQSVRNFVSLARQGFYDGLKFHRIIKGFMIQGGDPKGSGSGGPGYSIFGEFEQNGWENNLKHKRGVVSMARSTPFNSAGSQFFIMHKDNAGLDGAYAAFGKVTSGMDVVDRLAETPVIDNNGTVEDKNKPVIKSITIDSDVELPEPDKM